MPRMMLGTSAAEYVLEPAVWWTTAALTVP